MRDAHVEAWRHQRTEVQRVPLWSEPIAYLLDAKGELVESEGDTTSMAIQSELSTQPY
jgi:hypothetical protein